MGPDTSERSAGGQQGGGIVKSVRREAQNQALLDLFGVYTARGLERISWAAVRDTWALTRTNIAGQIAMEAE